MGVSVNVFLKHILLISCCVTIGANSPISNHQPQHHLGQTDGPVWHYRCEQNQCVKYPIEIDTINPLGLVLCRQSCGFGHRGLGVDVWPQINGHIFSQKSLAFFEPIDISRLRFRNQNTLPDNQFWSVNHDRLIAQCRAKRTSFKSSSPPENTHNENVSSVNVDIYVRSHATTLRMGSNETYRLTTSSRLNGAITVRIEADTMFGARHGIETLSQIIVYDDIRDLYVIRSDVRLEDGPAYTHRGISLDTSRNYYPVDAIKRTIDAMAMVKLNVFHWHITDSHSFPVVIKSHPYLNRYGAFSPTKIYTAGDIKQIVRYAFERGVHVVPEFDAPAHVGEGWQFTNLTTCFNAKSWSQFCYEAPCGQLDPTQDRLYDILEDIYRELLDMFANPQWFHMGGDEVMFECWNTSDSLVAWMNERNWSLDQKGFMQLWDHFQRNALLRLNRASIENQPEKVLVWTSSLTEDPFIDGTLSPDQYIIQVWSTGTDANIQKLLAKGYELVISNHDTLYLDCGYESWIGLGNNWCSPYSGWHKIYAQDLKQIGGSRHGQILGAEAILWSEQADEQNLDGRIWPRGIALAERLWSDPSTSFRLAEPRILLQRQRFIENGIRAEQLQPEWCLQNEGNCPQQ